ERAKPAAGTERSTSAAWKRAVLRTVVVWRSSAHDAGHLHDQQGRFVHDQAFDPAHGRLAGPGDHPARPGGSTAPVQQPRPLLVNPSFLVTFDQKARRWLEETHSQDELVIDLAVSRCFSGSLSRELRLRRSYSQDDHSAKLIHIGE